METRQTVKPLKISLLVVSVGLLGVTACSSSNPAAPTPPPTTTPPTPVYTLSAHVTAVNGGQPLAGLSGTLSGPGTANVTTDAGGSFSTTLPAGGTYTLTLTGSSIIPRSLKLNVLGPQDAAVTAIAMGSGFDQNFYRQLARGTMDQPTMQPLRHWTRNVNLYIQTTTLVDGNTIDMIDRTIRDAVPRWTANHFTVQSTLRGSETREGQADWLTVKWLSGNTGHCDYTLIGLEGGSIELHPQTPRCACGGYGLDPTVIRHATGHAMGYWHTDSQNDVMYSSLTNQCDKPLSARETYHAGIMYNRQVGNVDPDSDLLVGAPLASVRIH